MLDACRTHPRRSPALRPRRRDEPVFRTGTLTVDLEKRRVTVAGEAIRLSPTEYAVLVALVRNADHVVTDTQLLRQMRGLSTAR